MSDSNFISNELKFKNLVKFMIIKYLFNEYIIYCQY